MANEFSNSGKAKAWTQEQLASAADIDVRTVQRVETDRTKSHETIQAIAGALDVDVKDLRTTWLIPESKLVRTWLVTDYRAFVNVEQTRPAHQFGRMIVSPLTEEGHQQVDELLQRIFADRELIEPYETDLWGCYLEQIEEPLQRLFDLDQAIFVLDEHRDYILPNIGHLEPIQQHIDNWRVMYYVVVPSSWLFSM